MCCWSRSQKKGDGPAGCLITRPVGIAGGKAQRTPINIKIEWVGRTIFLLSYGLVSWRFGAEVIQTFEMR